MWVRTVHWLVGVRPVFVLPALSDSGDCLLMLPVHLRDGLLVLLVGIGGELVEAADCVALHAVHALEEADRDGSPDEADYDEAPDDDEGHLYGGAHGFSSCAGGL